MKSKIYIRADGGPKIGMGHLVRCLAIAHMLRHEFEICFVSKNIPDGVRLKIEKDGFLAILIENEDEFLKSLSGKEFVILDNYELDAKYQKILRSIGVTLICVDDLYENEFYADLIINHAPGITAGNYTAQPYTQFALGPDYALLRPAFLNIDSSILKTKKSAAIFICFGGADFKNLTLRTLELILLKFNNAYKRIIVVTGAAYEGLEKLNGLIKTAGNIEHYHDIGDNEMFNLMAISEVAVVPSSGILLEVLAVGCKVISGAYIENQKRLFENYKKINAFVSAEDFSIESLESALKAIQSWTNSDRLIDGKSGERILKIFKQLSLEGRLNLRRAEASDIETTYKWAEDKSMRAFSFNQNPIKYEEHYKWFLSKLEDRNCYYFIAELDNAKVGSIRFDIKGQEAVISFLVDKGYQNKGLGVALLRKGMMALMSGRDTVIKQITGFVMFQNIASTKAFEKLGFEKQTEETSYKYTIKT